MGCDGLDRVSCGLCADSFRLRERELSVGEGYPDAGAESGFWGLGAAAVGILTLGEAAVLHESPLCCCPGQQQLSDGCALTGCRPGRCWWSSRVCSGSEPRTALGLPTRSPSAVLEPKRCPSHQVHCRTGALTALAPLGRLWAPRSPLDGVLRIVVGLAL